MKRNTIFTWTIALSLLTCVNVPRSKAQEIYKAFVSEVCISTNASGRLVYRPFTSRDFIRKCASDAGITNLTGLSLVFNRTANALQVVSGTNHDLVCTPLSFSGGVSLSNSNNTKVERLEFVFADADRMAAGTLKATERSSLGLSNQLSGFQLTGRLQYAVSAAGTNGPAIYTGTIVAGRLRNDHHDSDDDDDQGEDQEHHGRD
jgi:hypothetical protein